LPEPGEVIVSKKGRRGDSDGIFDVNMTPLIDVSLVLVVILMVALPMAFQSSIAVRNAAASGRKAEESTRLERVEISIVSEDSVSVNKLMIAPAALGENLRPILWKSATRQVVVRCADGVSHGLFVAVLDEAKASGAAQIALVEK
jgi:biopolymer transport protein ExbD